MVTFFSLRADVLMTLYMNDEIILLFLDVICHLLSQPIYHVSFSGALGISTAKTYGKACKCCAPSRAQVWISVRGRDTEDEALASLSNSFSFPTYQHLSSLWNGSNWEIPTDIPVAATNFLRIAVLSISIDDLSVDLLVWKTHRDKGLSFKEAWHKRICSMGNLVSLYLESSSSTKFLSFPRGCCMVRLLSKPGLKQLVSPLHPAVVFRK